jgi:hypothetical protein
MGSEGRPFFVYRGETCITGMVLTLASYFAEAGQESDRVFEWLLAEQLEGGGWNCQTVAWLEAFLPQHHISVLEGCSSTSGPRR